MRDLGEPNLSALEKSFTSHHDRRTTFGVASKLVPIFKQVVLYGNNVCVHRIYLASVRRSNREEVREKSAFTQRQVASTVSTTRKKRKRLDTVNDPVEPFSPDTYEADFDDIEPEPQELPTGSLPVVQESDPHEECYRELCALRAKFAREHSCDLEDILYDTIVQYISSTLPCDMITFKEVQLERQVLALSWRHISLTLS